ncbi:hypothetical protein N8I77_005839 [Diaporthe amygdali]|uniref:Uncharacterized protein n=1 Tax=Phomopsis amygdali TaxID=1214568 RepID=A0AAD9SFA6_PHOAM|nr:hypothetical protein N8I77_005839 [Diaporthe amygdali]
MPAFTNGAIAPPNHRKKLNVTPEPSSVQEDDLDEELVDVGEEMPTEQAHPEIDQYSDPPESPDEFRSDVLKEQGITGFIVKVAGRLRTLKPPVRLQARHQFYSLIRELNVDMQGANPVYSQTAAFKIRNELEKWGLGETLLLDFERLLHHFEERAERHREETERKAQEYEEEQRKKQEWDVVTEDDANDDWELV